MRQIAIMMAVAWLLGWGVVARAQTATPTPTPTQMGGCGASPEDVFIETFDSGDRWYAYSGDSGASTGHSTYAQDSDAHAWEFTVTTPGQTMRLSYVIPIAAGATYTATAQLTGLGLNPGVVSFLTTFSATPCAAPTGSESFDHVYTEGADFPTSGSWAQVPIITAVTASDPSKLFLCIQVVVDADGGPAQVVMDVLTVTADAIPTCTPVPTSTLTPTPTPTPTRTPTRTPTALPYDSGFIAGVPHVLGYYQQNLTAATDVVILWDRERAYAVLDCYMSIWDASGTWSVQVLAASRVTAASGDGEILAQWIVHATGERMLTFEVPWYIGYTPRGSYMSSIKSNLVLLDQNWIDSDQGSYLNLSEDPFTGHFNRSPRLCSLLVRAAKVSSGPRDYARFSMYVTVEERR